MFGLRFRDANSCQDEENQPHRVKDTRRFTTVVLATILLSRTALDRHYLAVIQRKLGALRNGAPFTELPPAFRQLQDLMLRRPGGDREPNGDARVAYRPVDGRHSGLGLASRRAGRAGRLRDGLG